MANLSITNVCNKRCVYCFANDTRKEYGKSFMDDLTYDRALDYIERSGLKQARLLGGEPTTHPKFISYVQKALERNLDIMVFTNGLMSQKVLNFLAQIPAGKLSILLNTIHPNENNPRGISRQKQIMAKLAPSIILGITIYSTIVDLEYLTVYLNEFNLKKEVRLGLAHSVLSQQNRFLHPKNYSIVGRKIARFKEEVDVKGIKVGFDCGFVPCMFPPDSFELLHEELKKAGNCCHPIIDMLSDDTCISCYPLNDLKKIKLHSQLTAPELIEQFEKELRLYNEIGIYPYCRSCPLFKTRCNGGCYSFRIQRYQNQT